LQSVIVMHCSHVWLCGSHTGVSIGQSALFVQFVPHVCVSLLHTGVGGLQSITVTQPTHCFVPGSHFGLSIGQSESVAQLPLHVFVVRSQNGVGSTHAVWFIAVHCTQKPSGSLHAGFALGQSESIVHFVVHTCMVGSQTLFVPEQSMDVSHWTHVFVGTSHTGFAAVHACLSVAVHSTHAPVFTPLVAHAGRATSKHGKLPGLA
jgi:hypothetical protein